MGDDVAELAHPARIRNLLLTKTAGRSDERQAWPRLCILPIWSIRNVGCRRTRDLHVDHDELLTLLAASFPLGEWLDTVVYRAQTGEIAVTLKYVKKSLSNTPESNMRLYR